jgi:subtilisin-like proprotein convertase family protein
MSVQEVPAASRRLRLALSLAVLSALIGLVAAASAATFSNPALVFINDRWGTGSPTYPSVINVSGTTGFISSLAVTLSNISHQNPDDLDVLLVGPGGQAAVIMSDAGGSQDAVNVTITLDSDDPVASLPDEGPLVSGTFGPTNYGGAAGADTFPDYGPSPSPIWPFGGTTANGAWRLFVVDDETNDTGSIAGGWSLQVRTGTGSPVFSNPTAINVSDAQAVGKANPYPSSIVVSGLVGNITDVNATLTGFSHTFPADADVLLVGPTGANTTLMSDACGDGDLSGANLTFDDGAAATLPNTGQCVAGSYKPSDYVAGDTFPAPAPVPNATVALANFNGTMPNGTWSLYVVDDAGLDVGRLAGGWSLDITVSGPTAVELATLSATPAQGEVAVRWRTSTEVNLVGFDVYRGSTKLNRSPIAARLSGSARGASYVYLDRTGPTHGSVSYRLQLIRPSGARSFGGTTTLVRSR